jgi:hypothetical protein
MGSLAMSPFVAVIDRDDAITLARSVFVLVGPREYGLLEPGVLDVGDEPLKCLAVFVR